MQKGGGNFWSYIDNFYLRKPSDQQLERLGVLRTMLESELRDAGVPEDIPSQGLLLRETLNAQFHAKMSQLELNNLAKHVSISQELFLEGTGKRHWKTVDKIRRQKESFIPRKKKQQLDQLEEEQEQLDQLIQSLSLSDQKDEILEEIINLGKEAQDMNDGNKHGLADLESKVREEIKTNKIIFIINAKQVHVPAKRGRPRNPRPDERSYKVPFDLMDPKARMEVQQKFIEYAFVDIERKIMAESMSKIVSVKKEKSGNKFEVVFEEASQWEPILLDRGTLVKLNRLKELSLLRFYRVSGKCQYGNICQNISGFSHLYRTIHQSNTLKNATAEVMLEKLVSDTPLPAARKLFDKFDICHNCQELHHETYFVPCSYRATRPKWESDNPYAPRHNELYSVIDGVFVCLRKYCRHCLNNSYVNRKKNGLCPFCQEMCYCPRCEKQGILTRFKGIYEASGGDISVLDKISIIKPLKKINLSTEIHKKKSQKQPLEVNSMECLRDQMEECRQICQMIKRREKQKLKLVDSRKELFERNLDFFREGGFLKRELPLTENMKEGEAERVYWQQRGKLKRNK